MYENIVSLLGGRVAEELVIGDISTGASNDIERATKIAKSMVTKYGMSDKVGTITFGSDSEEVFIGRDWGQEKTYSEGTAAVIDSEIKKIIDSAYEQARAILNDHRDKLDAVAAVLIEKEKITGQEFDQIFGDGIKTEQM
jgi:cell division protease FtsH